MTWLYIVLAVAGFIAMCVAPVAYMLDRPTWPCIAGGAIGLVMFVWAVASAVTLEQDQCAARGGRMVESGPPIYVRSGNVMIPVEQKSCQVQP